MRRRSVVAGLLALFIAPQPAFADRLDLPTPPVADEPRPPVARAAAASTRKVLAAHRDAGRIDQATYDARRADYDAAQRAIGRLTGLRRALLRRVVSHVDRVAAAGRLSAGRLPLAFETIRRNREWWTTKPLVPAGFRTSFPGSELVWQFYPGEGMHVQWLGTFGKANGLWQGRFDARLSTLLDEAALYASPRAGGLAWESWFAFNGGAPPWVSALSAGTAVQAYARGAIRLKRPELFETGRAGLGVFSAPAPEGVAVQAGAGAHYLIYSFAPRLRVLNGFNQAVNGLHDFALLANDAPARALYATGEARLREELPSYDNGAWSRYSNQRESDLGYHKLARDFLRGTCQRLTDGRARDAASPDPAPYCDTARRFTSYLTAPPELALQRSRRSGTTVVVPYTLSKISTVTTSVRRGARIVAGRTVRLGRGRHELRFPARGAGSYAVSVRAVDLAGNAAGVTGAVRAG